MITRQAATLSQTPNEWRESGHSYWWKESAPFVSFVLLGFASTPHIVEVYSAIMLMPEIKLRGQNGLMSYATGTSRDVRDVANAGQKANLLDLFGHWGHWSENDNPVNPLPQISKPRYELEFSIGFVHFISFCGSTKSGIKHERRDECINWGKNMSGIMDVVPQSIHHTRFSTSKGCLILSQHGQQCALERLSLQVSRHRFIMFHLMGDFSWAVWHSNLDVV